MNGSFLGISATMWVILGSALVTYATRIGGHLVLSRFRNVPARVNVALNAVPAAVIAALVAPALISHGAAEIITLAAATVVGYRFSIMPMFLFGWALVVALRAAGL